MPIKSFIRLFHDKEIKHMFKQGSTRISMVVVVALALLLLLITSTTGPAGVALAKADGVRNVQQVNARQMQPMTATMAMGQVGMSQQMQMLGLMMQMMGQMQILMPHDMGAMTSTMPMTGAMSMGNAKMTPMTGMMGQMHNMMMQHMQSMMAACPGAMPAMGAMTMTGSMTNTMPMTSAMSMSQMMQSHMQNMMGMGAMSNIMPMTGTMAMHQLGSSDQRVMMGRHMQMMGLMMQMTGMMEEMRGAGMGTMSNTMPMTGTMPMSTEMCQMMGMMNQMMPMMQMTDSPMQPFDLLFIDSMIMHHQGAIDMAKEAQQKAEHPELKKMADDIIASQTSEIKQMQGWRKAWYPNALQTKGMGMDMGTMKIVDDASKPFDLRFMEAMTPHHQGAISMAKEAQAKAQHQEIKALAGNIIEAQQKEIAQMNAWKAAWFK
jgi:uncharacterized protein (DUF305 family)